MKDKMDILLENAYKKKFEPDKNLNEKILNVKNVSMKSSDMQPERLVDFKKKSFMDSFTKVAVVVFCVGSIGAFGALAFSKMGATDGGNKLSKGKAVVETTSEYIKETKEQETEVTTEKVIDYTPDEESIKEWNELKKKLDFSDSFVSQTYGTEGDNWLSRELILIDNGYVNIRYSYDDYAKALADSGISSMFTKDYKVGEYGVTYTDILNLGNRNEGLYRTIDSWFDYKNGKVYVSQNYEESVSDDYSFTSGSKGQHNDRLYENKNGYVFKLTDVDNDSKNLFDENWDIATETLFVSPNNKTSYNISFMGVTEDEMHEFLDTVVVNNEVITNAPKREDRGKIIQEIKKYRTK